MRPSTIFTLLVACTASNASQASEVQRDHEFAAAHPHAAALVLSESTFLDVAYERRSDGVRGEWVTEVVYWIRHRQGIDLVNRHARWNSPRLSAGQFEVEIVPEQGKRRRVDHRRLRWIPYSDAERGVYSFDTQAAYTVIEGLREGDLLRIRTRAELRDLHGIPTVRLGTARDLPTRQSELIVRHPRDHSLLHEWTGSDELRDRILVERSDVKGRTQVRFSLESTAPSALETYGAYVPTDHVRFIGHFTEVGGQLADHAFAAGASWQSVGSGYARRIEEVFATDPAIVGRARSIVAALPDRRARIDALFEDVQRRCRYLGLFEGLGGILPEPATVTAEREFGDCKGLSTLLIAMLRSIDIDAYPVLVRTRSAGPLATLVPNLAQFNHFIVWAEDGEVGVWLDPTYDFCPAGLVPTENAAWPVLRLGPGVPQLVTIEDAAADPGLAEITLHGSLGDDGSLQIEVHERTSGNLALRRRILMTDPMTTSSQFAGVVVDRSLLTGKVDLGFVQTPWQQPAELRVQVQTRRGAAPAGSRLYLSRRLLVFELPPLDGRRRVTDLDLRGLGRRNEQWSLSLPAGAWVRPDSASVEVEGLSWSFRVWQEESTLRLQRTLIWQPIRLGQEPALLLARQLEEIAKAENGHLVIELGARP